MRFFKHAGIKSIVVWQKYTTAGLDMISAVSPAIHTKLKEINDKYYGISNSQMCWGFHKAAETLWILTMNTPPNFQEEEIVTSFQQVGNRLEVYFSSGNSTTLPHCDIEDFHIWDKFIVIYADKEKNLPLEYIKINSEWNNVAEWVTDKYIERKKSPDYTLVEITEQ